MRIALLVLTTFLLFTACDKVEEPFDVPVNNNNGGEPGLQRILLEDLTGFRCTNCPAAASTAENLKSVYGDRLIVVGVHMVDIYAEPLNDSPDEPFSTDFRTDAGSTYETAFNVFGIPSGMLNRRIIDNTAILTPTNWGSEIPALLEETPKASVAIDGVNYNTTSRQVSFEVSMSVVENMDPGQYFMTAYLVEDSIYDWQVNNGEEIEHYLHRHVLRDNINGTWGALAFSSGDAGQQNTLNYQYTLDQAWKEEHCEIVAYLYRGETREIVQVNKAWVMNP